VAPEYRQTVSFLEDANEFIAKRRVDFFPLLKEGMELFGLDAKTFARELGILPLTVETWLTGKSKPYAIVQVAQVAVIEKLVSHAPQYEAHYGIVWCKRIDKSYTDSINKDSIRFYEQRIVYWHGRWMITNATSGCWSPSGSTCWGLWDTRSGLVVESESLRLVLACARERILDEASEVLSTYQYEVS
jgi:hypothetical protein